MSVRASGEEPGCRQDASWCPRLWMNKLRSNCRFIAPTRFETAMIIIFRPNPELSPHPRKREGEGSTDVAERSRSVGIANTRVGKGALLRAVPTGQRPLVGPRSLSSGVPEAGPGGFAHPTALPYDRKSALDQSLLLQGHETEQCEVAEPHHKDGGRY